MSAVAARKNVSANPVRRYWAKWTFLTFVAAALFLFFADFSRWEALSDQGRASELEEALGQSTDGIGRFRADLFRHWLAFKQPDQGGLRFGGALSLAIDASGCRDSQTLSRKIIAATYSGDGVVCQIEMSAFSENPSMSIVGRMAYWPDGIGGREKPQRTMRGSKKPAGRKWSLSFNEFPVSGAAVRLVAIAGKADIQGTQPWFAELLRAPLDSPAFDAARNRIELLGYRVYVQSWHRQ